MRIRMVPEWSRPEGRDGAPLGDVATKAAMLLAVALTVLTACGGGDQGGDVTVTSGATTGAIADPDVGADPDVSMTGATTAETMGDDTSGLAEVILTLAVPWEPEDGLSEEEIAAIADAQQKVLGLLDGTRFRVIRLYEITPQMALGVDDNALTRLQESDLVVVVSPNTLDPATG